MNDVLSLLDLERQARSFLPRSVFAYVASGVEDEVSLRENRRAFDDVALVPRHLVGVADRSQAVTLLGRRYASPFGIAPVGLCALAAYRGDLALAGAAHADEIPMIVSGASLIPLETIMAANPHAWFQMYPPAGEVEISALIERIAEAGVRTLVVTIDMTVPANRETMVRAGFNSPLRPNLDLLLQGLSRPRWTIGTFLRTLLRYGLPHFENYGTDRGVPILSRSLRMDHSGRELHGWRMIRHIRERWRGDLVIKGILHPDDGRRALDAGADALIVSNHGARQIDGVIASYRALAGVTQIAGGQPVMMDGGIRRGTDVIKAAAHGAACVFLGRPFVYAAALGGEPGTRYAIALLRKEIQSVMGLLGLNRIADIDRGCLSTARAGDDAGCVTVSRVGAMPGGGERP